VPVALDHLRGHGRGLETEPRADALLVLGLEMAECADSSRQLAHAHVLGGRVEASQVALHLRIPVQQLQAEGRRLGMDAVRAADRRRVLELEGAALEDRQQLFSEAFANQRDASFTCKACAVSTMSFEVSP
jgi:hypothetical protein